MCIPVSYTHLDVYKRQALYRDYRAQILREDGEHEDAARVPKGQTVLGPHGSQLHTHVFQTPRYLPGQEVVYA